MDYQKIILVGNTTKDAEVKQSEGKAAYADLALAVSRTKDQKTFFPVRVFGKLAEGCQDIKKGARVLVEGRLDISDYLDRDSQRRVTFRDLGRCLPVALKRQGEAVWVSPLSLLLGRPDNTPPIH